MFKPFLALGPLLGLLLVLVPQPTTGFTVKLQGNDNTFGVKDAEEVKKETMMPIGDDAFPDPKGKNLSKETAPTSDEIYLESLDVEKPMTINEIDNYLRKYGYLSPPVNGTVSENERKDAIKEFQQFSRLVQSGVVDADTSKQMKKPRCGLADPVSKSKFADFNAKAKDKWKKKHLTYKIEEYSSKLPMSIVREWTAKAFKMWSDVSQLTFTEVKYGSSDLRVKFTPRVHGDGHPFDGRGGVLGHAFFPDNGNIHLDEAENWTVKTKKGTNLLFVLVHEIGHALGLGHTNVDRAIMEPVYSGYRPNLALERDDIAGIQYLYGKPKVGPPKPKPPTRAPFTRAPVTRAPSPRSRKFPCPFYFRAAMTAGGKTYGFAGLSRFEILPSGGLTGRTSISSTYRGGPYIVEAAAHDDGKHRTFLFKNQKVWRFTFNRLDVGFPKTLKYFVRAAIVADGQLIAFSFTHIHYLNQDTMDDYVDGEVTIKNEYPGLPDSIRAAVAYGGGSVYVLSTSKAVQLDMYTGEIKNVKTCY